MQNRSVIVNVRVMKFGCVQTNACASGMSVHGTVGVIVNERAIVNVTQPRHLRCKEYLL